LVDYKKYNPAIATTLIDIKTDDWGCGHLQKMLLTLLFMVCRLRMVVGIGYNKVGIRGLIGLGWLVEG